MQNVQITKTSGTQDTLWKKKKLKMWRLKRERFKFGIDRLGALGSRHRVDACERRARRQVTSDLLAVIVARRCTIPQPASEPADTCHGVAEKIAEENSHNLPYFTRDK